MSRWHGGRALAPSGRARWGILTATIVNWSEEQAKEYADTLADVHRLSGQLAAEQSAQARPGTNTQRLFLLGGFLPDRLEGNRSQW